MSESELGSLGQAARGKHLRGARWFLIVVGVINVGINGIELAVFDRVLEEQIHEYERQGMVVDRDFVVSITWRAKMFLAAIIFAGALMVVCGLAVYQQPVICTVLGLVLYLLLCVAAFQISPELAVRSLVVRILFILGLCKTVAIARAYQKAMRPEEQDMESILGATPQTF